MSSWSVLRCHSCLVSTYLRWPLFDAQAPPTRVKRCDSRRIVENEKAVHVCRIRQDQWTAGISQPLGAISVGRERCWALAHLKLALPFAAAEPMEWVHCHFARRPMARAHA